MITIRTFYCKRWYSKDPTRQIGILAERPDDYKQTANKQCQKRNYIQFIELSNPLALNCSCFSY